MIDYEALSQDEKDNDIVLTIEVDDGTDTDQATVTIEIEDVNESPEFGEVSYSFSVPEDALLNMEVVGVPKISATDEDASDTPTFSFVDGAGSSTAATGIPFSINSSGEIRVSAALNYEDNPSYALHVLASDRSGTSPVTVEVEIIVLDVNEAPVFGEVSYNLTQEEHTDAGMVIDIVSADDPENDGITYSLSGDSRFTIDGSSGAIRNVVEIDYELLSSTEQGGISVIVTADDGEFRTSLDPSISVTIVITDVDEAPVFSGSTTFTVSEDATSSVLIGTVSAEDPERDVVSYTLSSSTLFEIGTTNGELRLISGETLDYETPPTSYTLMVQATSNGKSSDQVIEIEVLDVSEFPTITNISPRAGSVGEAVTISGTSFSTRLDDNTVVFLGDAADNLDDVTALISFGLSSTELVVSVPVGALSGSVRVEVGDEGFTSTEVFKVLPTITEIAPEAGAVGATLRIVGTGFSSTSLENRVTFVGTNDGGSDDKEAVVSSASATVLVVLVPSSVISGPLRVEVGGEVIVSVEEFVVSPKITSISPEGGPVGETVRISGTSFSEFPSENMVVFLGDETDELDDVASSVLPSSSREELVVAVPIGAISGPISVEVREEMSISTHHFSVIPTIRSFSPESGHIGTTLRIVGTGFSETPSDNVVTFECAEDGSVDDKVAEVTSASNTVLVVKVPEGSISGVVRVIVGSEQAVSAREFVVKPEITSIDPERGAVGSVVKIVGTGFSSVSLANVVTFLGSSGEATDDQEAFVIFSTPTELQFEVPEGAKTGSISVRVGTEVFTSVEEFQVLPLIVSLSPLSGPVGATLRIIGTNFSEIASANVVTFLGEESNIGDDRAAVVRDASSILIEVEVPSSAVSGFVRVEVRGEISTSSQIFTILLPDITAITSLASLSGSVGTDLTIGGQNFSEISSENVVTFLGGSGALDDRKAAILSDGSTELEVEVPAGARTGQIMVKVSDSEPVLSMEKFEVVPTIRSLSLDVGPVGAELEIVGTGFSSIFSEDSVSFDRGETYVSATAYASVSGSLSEKLIVKIPRGARTAQLRVKVLDDVPVLSEAVFNVVPTIRSLSSDIGSVGTELEISGLGFSFISSEDSVSFDGGVSYVSAISYTSGSDISSEKLMVKVPRGARTAQLRVKVLDGTPALSEAEFTVLPLIRSIGPIFGSVGSVVKIVGTSFSTIAEEDSVSFDEGATYVSASEFIESVIVDTIMVLVPSWARTGRPMLKVLDGPVVASSQRFSVVPTISSISPMTGQVGEIVTIVGTGFSDILSENIVTFVGTSDETDDVLAMVTDASNTELEVEVPEGALSGPIRVEVNGVSAESASFTVDDPELINVDNVEQLSALRADLDGDGSPDVPIGGDAAAYTLAYERARGYETAFGLRQGEAVGCEGGGCEGYELTGDLNFESASSYASGILNNAWISPSHKETVATEGWQPVGDNGLVDPSDDPNDPSSSRRRFIGTFDGNGYKIVNLYVDRPTSEQVGFFGALGDGAEIRDVGLENASVTGKDNAGALVGLNNGGVIISSYATGSVEVTEEANSGTNSGSRMYGSSSREATTPNATGTGSYASAGCLVGENSFGTMRSCRASGSAIARNTGSSNAYAGYLVGYNRGGIIEDCYATGDAHALVSKGSTSYAISGGLAGMNDKGRIAGSYAIGDVVAKHNGSGSASAGGLVGYNLASSTFTVAVENSYATGSATATATGDFSDAGGLVGWNNSEIRASYATGDAEAVNNGSGNAAAGGLVGRSELSGTIASSYAIGSSTAVSSVSSAFAGGLAGWSNGKIRTSYATGEVSGENTGGIVGNQSVDNAVEYSYFDYEVSGRESTEAHAQSTVSLQHPLAYDNDLDAENSSSIYETWHMDENDLSNAYDFWDFGTSSQYPVLKVDFNGGGTSTAVEFGVDTEGFSVQGRTGVPSIVSFSPLSGSVGAVIKVAGIGFSGTAEEDSVSFGSDVYISASSVTPDLRLNPDVVDTISVSVPAGAQTGQIMLKILGSEAVSSLQTFTLLPPTITNISPEAGAVGEKIKIIGSGFSSRPWEDSVSFDGGESYISAIAYAAGMMRDLPDMLTVLVPLGARTGEVMLKVLNGEVVGSVQEFRVVPVIESLSPEFGPSSSEIKVIGTGFSSIPEENIVTFLGEDGTEDDRVATITFSSTTELHVLVPSDAVSGFVSVVVDNESVISSMIFRILDTNELAITDISPEAGSVGMSVTISGQNFGDTSEENTVTFLGSESTQDDQVAVISTSTTTELQVSVPVGAQTGRIRVDVEGGEVVKSIQHFRIVPTITSISPEAGTEGTVVKISGTGFSSTASEDSVSFDNGDNYVAAEEFIKGEASAIDTLVIIVPSEAQTGKLMLRVLGGMPVVSASEFMIISFAITSISPLAGAVGTEVTISGEHFGATPEENIVTFLGEDGAEDNQVAEVAFASTTELELRVPNNAKTGPISVTINGETAVFSQNFTVTKKDGNNFGVPSSEVVFYVYPNPTSGKVRYTKSNTSGEYTYSIYSLVGQVVLSGNVYNNTEIDVSNLSDGEYILLLQDKNSKKVLRTRLLILK